MMIDDHRAAYLSVFYLKLSHLYEILPEGHDTPAFKAGELYGEDTVQLKKTDTRKQVQTEHAALMDGCTNLSSQSLRACQTSSGTAAGAPPPVECPCSSVEPYPKPCWSSHSQPKLGPACTEGPDMFPIVTHQ